MNVTAQDIENFFAREHDGDDTDALAPFATVSKEAIEMKGATKDFFDFIVNFSVDGILKCLNKEEAKRVLRSSFIATFASGANFVEWVEEVRALEALNK